MKKVTFIILTLISVISYAETATFKEAGFSIETLDQKPSPAGAAPLQMSLSPVNGFSGNVNVQIQPYPGTLKEYVSLSESQFVQMGLKTISSTSTNDTATFEYTGVMNGYDLHFYAKVFKKGNLFYLATATDLSSEWPKNKIKLMSVINSFKLN